MPRKKQENTLRRTRRCNELQTPNAPVAYSYTATSEQGRNSAVSQLDVLICYWTHGSSFHSLWWGRGILSRFLVNRSEHPIHPYGITTIDFTM